MSALQLVPDILPDTAQIHHPSCPMRSGTVPCICPTSTLPLEQEMCPCCGGELDVWRLYNENGWAEWLACVSGCSWREQL